MNIYKILPTIKSSKGTLLPPMPRTGDIDTIYSFHLTPVHPIEKGFFGLIIEHTVKYHNGGSQEIKAEVYFTYDNNGIKPTMRELFVLASAGRVIVDSLIKQQISIETPSLTPLIQKEHIDSINNVIQIAYSSN